MLANLLNSSSIFDSNRITFSYIYSKSYQNGFRQRVASKVDEYPIYFPDISTNNGSLNLIPVLVRRPFLAMCRLLLGPLLIAYEVIYLYILYRRINPDILHINNGGYPGALSSRLAAISGRLAGVQKIVMFVNNIAVDYKSISRRLQYPMDRLVVAAVDKYITGSKAAGRRLATVLDVPESSIISIPNGFDHSASSGVDSVLSNKFKKANSGDFYIGVLAVLVPRKGHRVLIDALQKLMELNSANPVNNNVMVFFAGDGVEKNQLIQYVEACGLVKYITFLGEIQNVGEFIHGMDVIVLPSLRDEDFPNVIIESMAYGKPVIGTKVAGIPEQIVDGVTGFLVEPGSSEQLRDSLIKCIRDPLELVQMGHAGKKRFEQNYTVSKIVMEYVNLYAALTEIK